MKLEDYRIKIGVINKLPAGAQILKVEHAYDMDNRKHLALRVIFADSLTLGFGVRTAHFDIHTGEYLGEVL